MRGKERLAYKGNGKRRREGNNNKKKEWFSVALADRGDAAFVWKQGVGWLVVEESPDSSQLWLQTCLASWHQFPRASLTWLWLIIVTRLLPARLVGALTPCLVTGAARVKGCGACIMSGDLFSFLFFVIVFLEVQLREGWVYFSSINIFIWDSEGNKIAEVTLIEMENHKKAGG